MSKIEINFNDLKYNLYDILNIPNNSDDMKIKKNFAKIIKNFHPDKNSKIEEDIYYHIILANQILLNKESRKLYDDFLLGTADTFEELKTSFDKTIKNVDQYFPPKDTSKHAFDNKIEELNKKHGFISTAHSDSVMDRFTKAKNSRDVNDIKIEKENFKTTSEFNNKFENNKIDGKFKDQLVEFKGLPSELSTYVAGDQYTSLNDIDKLYVEDSVLCSKFTSLDRAFLLQTTNTETNISPKTTEERMKEYRESTDLFKNMKSVDFFTQKFNEWR